MTKSTEFLPVNFATQSYQARSKISSSERLLNMYAEQAPNPDNTYPVVLYNTSGLKPFIDFDLDIAVNGLEKMVNDLIVVVGTEVFIVNSNLSKTSLGILSTTPARVLTANNGTETVILTVAGSAFIATATTLTEITDPNYEDSISVTYIDGFIIFCTFSKIFISGLFDASTYNALDFKKAEGDPDNIVKGIAHRRELWVFGGRTIEIFYNSGNPDFPFERLQGGFIEKGAVAKSAIVSAAEGLFFIGDDKIVYQIESYQPRAISNNAIERQLSKLSNIDDGIGWLYSEEGHKFYSITFPTDMRTFEYDLRTGQWHERGSIDSNLNMIRWRANNHVIFNNKNIIGDFERGQLYELDVDTFNEDGQYIGRELISSKLIFNHNKFRVLRFELEMETGVGLISGQGSDPEVTLQFSTDGGQTFSNEILRKLGKIGEYFTVISWDTLGQGRSFVFKIKMTDPVKMAVISANARIKLDRL